MATQMGQHPVTCGLTVQVCCIAEFSDEYPTVGRKGEYLYVWGIGPLVRHTDTLVRAAVSCNTLVFARFVLYVLCVFPPYNKTLQ